VSNLVTIAVTAAAVLFALYYQQPGGLVGNRALQVGEECCDCTTGLPLPSTPAPTPPTNPGFCFSAASTVELESGRLVSMKDLQLGDKVLVDENGSYEPIYSFAHYGPQVKSNSFVRIVVDEATAVVLSEDHLLWANGRYLPAVQVKEGDTVMLRNGSIATVKRVQHKESVQGSMAPFTPSGSIIVNGIKASSFVALENSVYIAGIVPLQWASHAFEFPHRLVCYYLDLCKTESYTDEGISLWILQGMKFRSWFLHQPAMIKYVLLGMMVLVFIIFDAIELCVWQFPTIGALLVASFWYYHRRRDGNVMYK
jgi:hypothetical protein